MPSRGHLSAQYRMTMSVRDLSCPEGLVQVKFLSDFQTYLASPAGLVVI